MPKFIIRFGLGSLDSAEIVEAESLDRAQEIANDAAREEAENMMEWDAEDYTAERAAEYGLEETSEEETNND